MFMHHTILKYSGRCQPFKMKNAWVSGVDKDNKLIPFPFQIAKLFYSKDDKEGVMTLEVFVPNKVKDVNP